MNSIQIALAKNGLLERIPIQGTRNHKQLRLTAAGWELANRTTQKLKIAEETAYRRLTAAELQTYLDITRRLTAYIREETEKL